MPLDILQFPVCLGESVPRPILSMQAALRLCYRAKRTDTHEPRSDCIATNPQTLLVQQFATGEVGHVCRLGWRRCDPLEQSSYADHSLRRAVAPYGAILSLGRVFRSVPEQRGFSFRAVLETAE